MSITTPTFDTELAEGEYETFGPYETLDFADNVQAILAAMRKDVADLDATTITDSEGHIDGYEVGITLREPESYDCFYLKRFIDLKNITTDRAATGNDQARAIRDVILSDYQAAKAFAQRQRFTTD